MLIGLLCLFFVDGFQLLMPRIIQHGVDALSYGRATASLMLKLAGFIMLLAVGVVVTRFFWRYLIIGISRRMEKRMRMHYYKHLLLLSPSWYSKHKVGDLMALATNDLDAVRMMVGIGMVATFDAGFLMLASLGMMIYLNPKLTLYVILPLPVLSVIVGYFGRILHRRFKKVQETFALMTDRVREIISGIRVVKSYAREDFETGRFRIMSKDYIRKSIRMVVIGGMFEPMIGFVIGFSFALVLLLGGRSVILASMSMGEFVAFNSYLGLLIWPMIAVGWVLNLYQRGRASLDRIVDVMEQKADIVDSDDAVELAEDDTGKIKGNVEFKDLTFTYDPELEPVLKDINCNIERGECMGITGRTGCGKTTLVSLIPRLFDPPDNSVFIEGVDIRKVKLKSLRNPIGFVPQDSFLFSATLMENIKFGNYDATDDEAMKAAEIAQLDKDIENFPDGYETTVGERGVTLSGGQKQRMAIARALLIDPSILILDDALSAVDTETESAILSRLQNARKNRTTIIISHRISALQNTDRIIVLDDGRIIETGAHEELLKKDGYYTELYKIQQIESELGVER